MVVKFCERYDEDAYRVLADVGLVLLFKGVFKAVMDFVDGRDAYNESKHRDLPRTVLSNTKRAPGSYTR